MNIQLDVSQKGMQKIQSLITSKLYSNKFTWIVELISNALDAYKRAGKEAHILFYSIELNDEIDRERLNIPNCIPLNHYHVVSDKALGLSKENFIDKICTVPKSDKDDGTKDEIGSFGIGSLSVFAYSKDTYWQTIKDDKIVIFHLYEDIYAGLQYEILEEKDNVDGLENGIRVFITIPDNMLYYKRELDLNRLRFINNILIENVNYINLKKTIYENELFKCLIDETIENKKLRILINNIVYDLDFGNLNISPINFPVYLKFNSNEIDIQPTRENLIYNQKTIDNILNKIEELRSWYEATWLKQNENRLYTIINYKNEINDIHINLSNKYYNFQLHINRSFPHCNLFSNEYIKTNFKLKYPIRKEIFESIYIGKLSCNYTPRYIVNRYHSISTVKIHHDSSFKILINENPKDEFKTKRARLLDVYKQLNTKGDDVVFYSKDKTRYLDSYRHLLDLKKYHKSEWREIIQFFQNQLDIYEKDRFKYLKDFPETIIEKPPKEKKLRQEKNKKIGDVQLLRKPSRSCDSMYILDKTTIEYNTNKLYVYDNSASEKLQWLYLLKPIFKKAKLNCIIIKEKQMSDLLQGKENVMSNVIHVDDFFKLRHSALLKTMTCLLLENEENKTLDNLNILEEHSNFIDTYISSNIINEYNEVKIMINNSNGYINDGIKTNIISFAKENKFYDEYLYNKYYKLKNINSQLYFLKYFMVDYYSALRFNRNDDLARIVNDVKEFCKNRMIRYKIDLQLNSEKIEKNEPVNESENPPF